MAQPSDRLYTRSHEWILVAGNEATVGITAYAQEQLGDVVFVELPPAGRQVTKGGVLGNIESVKAVSEVFAPAAGEVVAANGELEAHPELVNQDPYGKGWLVRLKVVGGAAEGLLDAAAYDKLLADEGAH
jgi:glycine cleavage system H protein